MGRQTGIAPGTALSRGGGVGVGATGQPWAAGSFLCLGFGAHPGLFLALNSGVTPASLVGARDRTRGPCARQEASPLKCHPSSACFSFLGSTCLHPLSLHAAPTWYMSPPHCEGSLGTPVWPARTTTAGHSHLCMTWTYTHTLTHKCTHGNTLTHGHSLTIYKHTSGHSDTH